MAVKKKDDAIVVVEGDYFTATHNRKKIRGVVGYDKYDDFFFLCNNQSGENVKCEDYEDSLGFTNRVSLGECEEGTLADLKATGISNYIVLKDRRQKAVINKDKLPELGVGEDEYRVSIENDKYVIGCGAVELTKKQIEGYLRYRQVAEELENYEGSYIENLEIKEIEAYLKIRKSIDKGDEALYKKVVGEAQKNFHNEDQLNDIDESDIRALFDYADHVNSKK